MSLPGCFARQRHQLAEAGSRQGGIDQHQEGLLGQQRDGREFLRLVGQVAHDGAGDRHFGGGADQQRVAVRRGAGDQVGAERPGRAAAVLDRDRLAPGAGQPLASSRATKSVLPPAG